MNSIKPLVVAVAPNGARCSKKDHPNVPLSPSELAKTAADCLEAGARMIHLHVRDDQQHHTLSPQHYLPAISAVKDAIGDEMLIQVTSEAADTYNAEQQMSQMSELLPDFISIGLREFITDELSIEPFRLFIEKLSQNNTLIQYILYDENDYQCYLNLIDSNTIPNANHSLLFVLGRYTAKPPTIDIVNQYQDILQTNRNWMVCTFGKNGQQILKQAAHLNCNIRVGFENGFHLPNGKVAQTNAELVYETCITLKETGRPLATIEQTKEMLGL